jgi:hypothetical protein
MSYPKQLEEYTDKELFDLRDNLELNISILIRAKRDYTEEFGRLREVDREVERRDDRKDYEKDMEAFEEEYCCSQCYQIDKGEFKEDL